MKLNENNYKTKRKNDQITAEQLRSFWLRWKQQVMFRTSCCSSLRRDRRLHMSSRRRNELNGTHLFINESWRILIRCRISALSHSTELPVDPQWRTKRCTCFSSLWQHVFIWHQRRRRMWVVTSSTWDKDIVNMTIRESGCLWEVSTSAWCSVSVEAQTDSLQHPVWVVLGGGQVRLKHQPHTHGIPACGRGVDGGPQRVLWNKHTQQLDRHPDRDLQRSVRPEHSEVTPVTSGGELLWGRLWGSAAPQP